MGFIGAYDAKIFPDWLNYWIGWFYWDVCLSAWQQSCSAVNNRQNFYERLCKLTKKGFHKLKAFLLVWILRDLNPRPSDYESIFYYFSLFLVISVVFLSN